MKKYRKWTNEELQEEALKYESRAQFKQKSNAAASAAKRRGIFSEICSHMPLLVIPWNKESIIIEANKYSTRKEFALGSSGAYEYALRLKLIHKLFPNLNTRKYKTKDLFTEAQKYKFREDFRKGSYGHYQAAQSRKLLQDICAHMLYKGKGFKTTIPGILYYFKINGVWKIGVSNRPLSERYNSTDRAKMSNIIIQHYTHGSTAYEIEQEVLHKNKQYKYKGKTPFTDGTKTSECFTKDIRINNEKTYKIP